MDLGFWLFRQCFRQYFWCKRKLQQFVDPEPPLRITVPPHRLPWFWIGAEYPNKLTDSVTDMVNQFVTDGVRVDAAFLSEITGIRNATWKYMDAITLEEKEFPSEGIVINDTAN